MRRILLTISTLALLSVTLAGCSSKVATARTDATTPARMQSDRAPTPAREAPTQTTAQAEPVQEGDEGFVGPGSSEPETPEVAPAPARTARPIATRTRTRDGRPEWWLTEPVWADGRLSICAEALGEDIRAARRNAVEKGLGLLRSEAQRDMADEQVVYVTVRPLPIPAEAPGGARFAGYVMVSAVIDDGE